MSSTQITFSEERLNIVYYVSVNRGEVSLGKIHDLNV